MPVPKSLRAWFVIHFVVDMVFAVPLFFAPVWFLELFGFTTIDPVASRLVAAALFAIGGSSFLVRDRNKEAYQTLLNLKIIWSLFAVVGLVWGALEEAAAATWLFALIFAGFSGVWMYYRKKI